MRFLLAPIVLSAAALVLLPSCTREVPKPVVVVPATGWTAEDTQAVTVGLSEALAAHPWVGQFRESNGRQPVLEVRVPEDRSGDQVPVADLASAYGQALAGSDRLHAAAQGEVADVALVTIVGLRKVGVATYFTVDARVIDARTGESRWNGGLERPRQEPVPVPAPAPR